MVFAFSKDWPLGPTETRGWLRTGIAEEIWRTQSGTSILSDLRAQGVQIRTQDFFAIRRQVLELTKFQEQIEALTEPRRVPRAWMNDSHGWDLSNDFLYRIRVTGTDPQSGDEIIRHFSIGSNVELSKSVAQAELTAMLIGAEDFYDIVIEKAELYGAFVRPGVFEG